ncbi:MAG: hypothetical protein ACYDCA_09525 [Candidatus Tyrphobacter sp.]
MRERHVAQRLREKRRQLREGDAAIDGEVAQLLDDVGSQLAQNPADSNLSRLQNALQRYQTAAAAEADMMGVGDGTGDTAGTNDGDGDEDEDEDLG